MIAGKNWDPVPTEGPSDWWLVVYLIHKSIRRVVLLRKEGEEG